MAEVQRNAPVEQVDTGKGKRAEVVAATKGAALELKSEVKDIQVGFKTYDGGEWPRKEAERKDAKTPESGKNYTAIGAVDRVPFKPEVRSFEWYMTMGSYARHMARDFNRIDFQFPGLKNIPKNEKARQKILDIIKKVSTASIDAAVVDDPKKAAEAFKKILDAAGNSAEVYGAEGVLNVVLAYGRASDNLKGVTPENAGSIDYKLELSNKRYSKLFERKAKVEKPQDPRRKGVIERAKKEGKGMGETFNEVMEDFFAQNRKLIERIAVAVENGKMTPEEAKKYKDALDNLNYKNAVSSNEASDEDFARLALVDETVNRVRVAVEKAEKPEKPEKPAAPVAPKETYDERETRTNAMRIINEGNLEKRYAWKDESAQDVEAMVKRIAHDVVAAVNPADSPMNIEIPRYEEALYALIRASLRNELKDRIAARENKQNVSPDYVLNENEKVRYVSTVLSRMNSKAIRIRRNTPHF
ncbi:MAG: hypothetical protein NTX63_00875 [Candidatus Peregrinibacteria bacterium]|nr:hypothetical protein [Candidatus Peregrinibacteria bacterium]